MLTSSKVEDDILAMLNDSPLQAAVSGKVYRKGYRPRDSRKEDIVVVFVDGTPGQVEHGAVTINIYIPDLTPYKNGQYVKNGARLAAIEELADEWAKGLTANRSHYRFNLLRTIRPVADEAIHQHFVTVPLEYYFID